MNLFRLAIVALLSTAATVARADYKSMDYGPFLNATFNVKSAGPIYRGTAIGFDVPPGKTLMSVSGGCSHAFHPRASARHADEINVVGDQRGEVVVGGYRIVENKK